MRRDTHIHTNFSPDADPTATFQAYINEAQEKGFDELVFTDHVDFDAAHPLFYKMIDFDDYYQTFLEAKKEAPIPIKLGVEIGYQPQVIEEIKEFLARYPFEHVILSIHYPDHQDLYTGEYYQGKTEKEAYYRYFEIVSEAIDAIDQFTVFGHLDYITRYSPFGDFDTLEYQEIIDEILQKLIQKNKGIEINTSGLEQEGRTYPKQEIVKRFQELGGTTITLASDAHRTSELGRHFDIAMKLLKKDTN